MDTNIISLRERLTSSNDLIAKNIENGFQDLTAQQQAFGMAYVQTYNVKEAAIESKSPLATAKRWLRDPLMNVFISECQKVLSERSIISRDFVNMKWLELLPKVMGEEDIPMIDNEGNQYLGKKFDGPTARSVLTELSKSTNFYASGSSAKGAVSININLGALGIGNNEKQVGVTIEGTSE